MAADVYIAKRNFTNEKTGEIIPYNRLAIGAYINGEYQALELKLNNSEMLLAKIILSSNEEAPAATSRKANEEELDDFFKKNQGRSSSDDELNLDEE